MADFNLLDFQRAYQNHGKGGLMNYGIDRMVPRAIISVPREDERKVRTYISSVSEDKPVSSESDAREYQKKDEYRAKKEARKNAPVENPDDYVEFTYVPGDTFGQKILDLGIGTDNGLWGENGDVAFYTQQLIDGGYLDDNGNVKLGVPIRLKKRK